MLNCFRKKYNFQYIFFSMKNKCNVNFVYLNISVPKSNFWCIFWAIDDTVNRVYSDKSGHGILEFSPNKAGRDVTPLNLEFKEENKSSTLNSLSGTNHLLPRGDVCLLMLVEIWNQPSLYFTRFFCFGITVFASCLLRLLTSLAYFCVLQESRLNNSTFVYFHMDFSFLDVLFCPRPFIVCWDWDVNFDVSLFCPRFFLSSACMQACSTNWKGASQTSVRIKAIKVLNRIRDYATMSKDAVLQFAMIKTRLRVSTTKA